MTCYCLFSNLEPCKECIQLHNDLMDRRQKESLQIVIENLKDGYDATLPEQNQEELMREVLAEMKRRERARALRATVAVGPHAENPVRQSSRRTLLNRMTSLRKSFATSVSASPSEESVDGPGAVQRGAADTMSEGSAGGSENDSSSRRTRRPMFRESRMQKQLSESSDSGDGQREGGPAQVALKKAVSESLDKAKSASCSLVNTLNDSKSKTAIARESIADMCLENILGPGVAQEGAFCCILDKAWLDKWKKFVQAGSFEDIEFPLPAPGPISNHRLLRKECELRKQHARFLRRHGLDSGAVFTYPAGVVKNDDIMPELHHDAQYVVVSPGVWSALLAIYGGGPAIFREDVDIYSSEIEQI
jgi:hypothetical protein